MAAQERRAAHQFIITVVERSGFMMSTSNRRIYVPPPTQPQAGPCRRLLPQHGRLRNTGPNVINTPVLCLRVLRCVMLAGVYVYTVLQSFYSPGSRLRRA